MKSVEQYIKDLKFEFGEITDREQRLKELILYIADKCMDDPTFGAIKLNKILYFTDFWSYWSNGKPITGVGYKRLERGPAPDRMIPIRNQMQKDNEIVLKKKKVYGDKEQHRVVSLREANISLFSANEISLVDEVIHRFWGIKAEAISDFSHGVEWKILQNNKLIPYQASLLSEEGVTESDVIRARELINEYEWEV